MPTVTLFDCVSLHFYYALNNVGPSTWRTMKWLISDSVLLVLASDHYEAADYIRNYDMFIESINQKES